MDLSKKTFTTTQFNKIDDFLSKNLQTSTTVFSSDEIKFSRDVNIPSQIRNQAHITTASKKDYTIQEKPSTTSFNNYSFIDANNLPRSSPNKNAIEFEVQRKNFVSDIKVNWRHYF